MTIRSGDAIDRRTLSQQIYERLYQQIEFGALAPGERLDERRLCEMLNVSRTPLRHAVERLAADGLVEKRPYQGHFVRSFSVEDVDNLYRVRIVLEEFGIRAAVEAMSEEEIDELDGLARAARSAFESGDLVGLSEHDKRFHALIMQCSRNATLIDLLAKLASQIHSIRTFANRNHDMARDTTDDRAAVVEALRARDADRAVVLLGHHIDAVRRSVIAQLQAEAGVSQ